MSVPTAVSVCVPTYKAHGEPNLRTLAAGLDAALDGLGGELVVALNGIGAPEAGVPERARTVDLGVNRGVAPGWNAAASEARGEVLVFTNDDAVLGPGSLRLLHDTLTAHPEAGVVGPSGGAWDLAEAAGGEMWDTAGRPAGELHEVDVVSGYLFATRRSTYDAVGGFDEFYAPASFEEVDFCTAVRLEAGLKAYVVAGVDHEHEWGISERQPPWRRIRHNGRSELLWSIHRRNRRHFLDKWRERVLAVST